MKHNDGVDHVSLHSWLSIPLRMKPRQIHLVTVTLTITLSIPLRMKPTFNEKGIPNKKLTFNSFEDETSFTLSRWSNAYSYIFQFLWGWNAVDERRAVGAPPRSFQFLWGWNPLRQMLSKPVISNFQFLWGWNLFLNLFVVSKDMQPFNSFEDETDQFYLLRTVCGWTFNSFEDETVVSEKMEVKIKSTFNSFEDETSCASTRT